MPDRDAIRNLITAAGLQIVQATDTVIPTAMLDLLYTDLTPDLRRATQLFMGCASCEIGEVRGQNAVDILLLVCGQFTDPSKCDSKSVRGRFGVRQAEKVGNAVYFKNAIHRPKTVQEAHRDLELFRGFLHRTI